MAPLLSQFLSVAARRGFVRGEHDCMLFAADWVRALTGHDPARELRLSYATEDRAEAILAAAGGAQEMIEGLVAPLGWTRVDGARMAGDVALVAPPLHTGLAAGVCVCARKVALVTRRGLVVGPGRVLAAWRRPAHG